MSREVSTTGHGISLCQWPCRSHTFRRSGMFYGTPELRQPVVPSSLVTTELGRPQLWVQSYPPSFGFSPGRLPRVTTHYGRRRRRRARSHNDDDATNAAVRRRNPKREGEQRAEPGPSLACSFIRTYTLLYRHWPFATARAH